MSAHVVNATSTAAAAGRVMRAYGASTRQQVDELEGATAAPGREYAPRYYDDEDTSRMDPGQRRRRAEFQDQVSSFGGVLVSLEVGSTIVQAQSLKGLYSPPGVEAERQIANYEFAQSLMGPPQAMVVGTPFQR